jgi:hypothetical protein
MNKITIEREDLKIQLEEEGVTATTMLRACIDGLMGLGFHPCSISRSLLEVESEVHDLINSIKEKE